MAVQDFLPIDFINYWKEEQFPLSDQLWWDQVNGCGLSTSCSLSSPFHHCLYALRVWGWIREDWQSKSPFIEGMWLGKMLKITISIQVTWTNITLFYKLWFQSLLLPQSETNLKGGRILVKFFWLFQKFVWNGIPVFFSPLEGWLVWNLIFPISLIKIQNIVLSERWVNTLKFYWMRKTNLFMKFSFFWKYFRCVYLKIK